MKKNAVALAGVAALTASLTMVGAAGAQEIENPEQVATTAAPETTAAPAPEVTEPPAAPETTDAPEAPETTEAPAPVEDPLANLPEDTAPVADPSIVLEPIALPGNVVTSGTLEFNVSFSDSPTSGCSGTVALSSGQMNVGYDEVGRVGGMYGLTSTGSGTLGALLVGLGPIPAGIAVLSVSDANCEFDAIGVGSWSATASRAEFGGIGFGIYPTAYETGSYVDSMTAKATIGATGGAANLDFDQLRTFLLRERPGFPFNLSGEPEAPADAPEATPEG